MKHCDPDFRSLLSGFTPDSLERDPYAVYGIRHDATIGYVNPAWFEFAEQNGGSPEIAERWSLGASVLEATDEPLRRFYRRGFAQCLRSRRPWSHRYECSSASQYRRFHMHVYPLSEGAGLLVRNALVAESPHDPATRTPHAYAYDSYRDAEGLATQCIHCRRIRRGDDRRRWDWVPELVASHRPEITGSLCPACFHYHYPDAQLPSA